MNGSMESGARPSIDKKSRMARALKRCLEGLAKYGKIRIIAGSDESRIQVVATANKEKIAEEAREVEERRKARAPLWPESSPPKSVDVYTRVLSILTSQYRDDKEKRKKLRNSNKLIAANATWVAMKAGMTEEQDVRYFYGALWKLFNLGIVEMRRNGNSRVCRICPDMFDVIPLDAAEMNEIEETSYIGYMDERKLTRHRASRIASLAFGETDLEDCPAWLAEYVKSKTAAARSELDKIGDER